MTKLPTLKMKKRLYIVIAIFMVCGFTLVSGNIINITVLQHDFYSDKATGQQLKPKTIPATRGSIFESNGGLIAQSATVYDVIVAPDALEEFQIDHIADVLGDILGEDEDEKAKYHDKILTLSKEVKSSYKVIKDKVEKDIADEIRLAIVNGTPDPDDPTNKKKNTTLRGIDLVENSKRYYPNPNFASSLIGFTGTDSQGLYGVELQYEEELSGIPGYIVSARNAMGETMPVSYEEKFDPVNGNNIVLTLDESIQHFLYKALEKVMVEHKPDKGCAGIVMNVKTGEILAMVNLPDFDLNDPWSISDEAMLVIDELPEAEQVDAVSLERQKQWKNTNIAYAYQPGSTYKTIVASAALEERTDDLNSSFTCQGVIVVEDRKMGCHVGLPGHGVVDFTGALVNSCNPAFVKIGSNLGAQNYYDYHKAYGFTEKTGIDLPGENIGTYYDETMSTVSLASCSFGQSISVTPIQLITAVSAAVNGGELITPHVVKDILDENGNIIRSTQTEVKRQVISEESSAILRGMMEEVVDVKGGTNASVKGYRIGGKSGTSQKQNPGDDPEARIASYIGVAPANDPEIAVLVMVDESTTGDVYGTVIAAPPVAEVMADTLPYLGFGPQYTEEDEKTREMAVPYLLNSSIVEAEEKLLTAGFKELRIIGDGSTVKKQVPGVGEQMPKDGTVIIYTESESDNMAEMPNVIEMSPANAKSVLENTGFNVKIDGLATEHATSRITEQSIIEGQMAPIGTVVVITCRKLDTD